MKRYIKIILVAMALVSTLSFGSCSKWLDINQNPNAVTVIEPDYLFNNAVVNGAAARQGGDLFIALAIGSQIIADGGPSGGDWGEAYYQFSPFTLGNSWKSFYNSVALNLMDAIEIAEARGAYFNNTVAQCKIYFAYDMYMTTMSYGDIPFSEAFDIEKYPSPHFDKQKDVLLGCIDALDEAITLIGTPSTTGNISKYDLFYKGDMTKWLATAKSLKLHILMTMYDRDNTVAAKINDVITQGGLISSNAGNLAVPFFDTKGNQNPNYVVSVAYSAIDSGDGSQNTGGTMFFYAHESVVDPMVASADPRLTKYFTPGFVWDPNYDNGGDKKPGKYIATPGVYNGLKTSQSNVNKDRTSYNLIKAIDGIMAPTSPDMLLSYSDVEFNIAEAYARGIGVAKDLATARTHFESAVSASCQFYGVSVNDANTFAATFDAFTDANVLELINTQRWVSCVVRPFDAWTYQRRTDIPALSPPELSGSTALFQRLRYPTDVEISLNPNAPKVRPALTEKMWFNGGN